MVLCQEHLPCIRISSCPCTALQRLFCIHLIGSYTRLMMIKKILIVDEFDLLKYISENEFMPLFLEIIASNTSSIYEITEAKVTHFILAFHMLFVNILMLNLLIAMFK